MNWLKSSDLRLSHEHADYYYKHDLVVAVHQGDYILLNLRIPIQSNDATMLLFHVRLFPLPHDTSVKSGFTIITGVNEYFAVSKYGNYYASLTEYELDGCSRSHCERPFPISPRSSRSWDSVLFCGDTHKIDNYCEVSYTMTRRHVPFIAPIGGSELVVASDKGWLMKCQGKLPIDIPPCALCVISVPCHCNLHSRKKTVFPSFSNCVGSFNNTVTTLHPVNLLILERFFKDSQLHRIGVSTLLPKPVNLSLPRPIETVGDSSDITTTVPFRTLRKHMQNSKRSALKLADLIDKVGGEELIRQSELRYYVPWLTTAVVFIIMAAALLRLHIRLGQCEGLLLSFTALPVVKAFNPVQPGLTGQAETVFVLKEWSTPSIIVLSILLLLAVIWVIRLILNCLRTRGVLPNWTVSCAVTTIVMVLETSRDRIVLPVKTFNLPPHSFFIKEINPRSLRLQNDCCLARLFVDWGDNGSFLYHLQTPLVMPSLIPIPLGFSRRLGDIVSQPHKIEVRLFYDDMLFSITTISESRNEDIPGGEPGMSH